MDTPMTGSVPPQEDNTDAAPIRDSKGAATIAGDGSPPKDTPTPLPPTRCEKCGRDIAEGEYRIDSDGIDGPQDFCQACENELGRAEKASQDPFLLRDAECGLLLLDLLTREGVYVDDGATDPALKGQVRSDNVAELYRRVAGFALARASQVPVGTGDSLKDAGIESLMFQIGYWRSVFIEEAKTRAVLEMTVSHLLSRKAS